MPDDKPFEFVEQFPPELRDYVEYLQRQIAEAMRIPPQLLRAETHNELVTRAYQRTEVMRRELTELYIKHCWPQMRVPDET